MNARNSMQNNFNFNITLESTNEKSKEVEQIFLSKHYQIGTKLLQAIKKFLNNKNTDNFEIYTITNELQDNIYVKFLNDQFMIYFKIFRHYNNLGKEIIRIETFKTNPSTKMATKMSYIDIDYDYDDTFKIDFYINTVFRF